MPYVKTGATRHNLPTDPQYWVELRDHGRAGDRRVASEASTVRYVAALNEISPEDWHYVVDRTDDGERGLVVRRNVEEYNRQLMAQRIVRWNLTDENDQPLPVTPESMDLLEPEDWDFLWVKIEAGRPKEEEGPFVEPSNPSSEESEQTTPMP